MLSHFDLRHFSSTTQRPKRNPVQSKYIGLSPRTLHGALWMLAVVITSYEHYTWRELQTTFACVRVHLAFGLIYTEFRYIISRYPKYTHAVKCVYGASVRKTYIGGANGFASVFCAAVLPWCIHIMCGVFVRGRIYLCLFFTWDWENMGVRSSAQQQQQVAMNNTHAQSARGRVGSGRVLYTLNCTI